MKLLAYITLVILWCINASCTTAGRVKADGSIEGPMSFLGEAVASDVVISSSVGSLSVGAFATHNPDRALTREIGRTVLGIGAFKAAKQVNDNKTTTDNINATSSGAVQLKGTKDPNVIPFDPNIPK